MIRVYKCPRCDWQSPPLNGTKKPKRSIPCPACAKRGGSVQDVVPGKAWLVQVPGFAVWTDSNLPVRHQGALIKRPLETREDMKRARKAGIEWYSKKDHEYADSQRGKAAIEAYERTLRQEGVRDPSPIVIRTEKPHARRRRKVFR